MVQKFCTTSPDLASTFWLPEEQITSMQCHNVKMTLDSSGPRFQTVCLHSSCILGRQKKQIWWWFQIFIYIFYFHPYPGEDEPILTHMFEMGWNQQLENMLTWLFLVSLFFFPDAFSWKSWEIGDVQFAKKNFGFPKMKMTCIEAKKQQLFVAKITVDRSITGGIDWETAARPLKEISIVAVMMFVSGTETYRDGGDEFVAVWNSTSGQCWFHVFFLVSAPLFSLLRYKSQGFVQMIHDGTQTF